MQKPETSSLPKSLAEAKTVGHNLYFTGVPCCHGHTTYRYVKDRACAECVKLKVKRAATVGGGNARRWASKTPEQVAEINAKRRAYYCRTKEARLLEKKEAYERLSKNDAWRITRRQKVNTARKTKGRAPEKSNPAVKQKYRHSLRGKVVSRANDAKRHAAKLQRTPAWLTKDDYWLIEQAYELAALRTKVFGFSWHVDHVIPLQGKQVSGLHVPTNLQVIPWRDNVAKANKYLTA